MISGSFDKSVICPELIGRAAQVGVIEDLLGQVQAGRGQTLLISGEAGLGKSRLVSETRSRAAQRGWAILQGHCFETERAQPYAPILDLLRAYSIGHPPAEIIRSFGLAAPELVTLLPELAALLPDRPAPAAPEPDKHRLFFAVAQFCVHLAASRPLLLAIEDLHWSDEASLELLLYLVRHQATQPILLLFTYRSDETGPELTPFLAELDRRRLAIELSLSPLNREQVEQMLQAIFDQPHPIRVEFLETLYPLTEGNPFFIEETLKSMLMAGDIFYAEDGIWDRKPLAELHIPRSIQAAVQQRRNQLSPAAGQLLALAAVAGRRFDFSLLQHLTGHTEAELLAQLKELLATQFIVEASAEQFAFRHALTQAAIYATMLARERRHLHRTIAEALEALPGEPGPRLGDLAYHYYRGEIWDKALTYARQAGEKAQALYAPQAAIEHFSHALEAAGHLAHPVVGQLYTRRGQAYATLNNFNAAQNDYQAALDLAQAQNDPRAEWEILLALGDLWASRDYAHTGDYFRQAQDRARALNDPILIARSLNYMGNWHMNQERPFAALRDHQEALAIFQTVPDIPGIAQTLDLLGIVSYNCGDLLQGRRYYQQAIPLWQQLDDRQGLLHTFTGLALAVDFDLEVDDTPVAEAVAWGEKGVQVARDIGWRSGETLALICLGLALHQQGRYGLALETLHQALTLAEEIEHREWAADALRALGALYLELLALPEARQALERALALAYEINSRIWIGQSAGTLALVYILQGDLDRTRQLLDEVQPADTPMHSLQQRHLWRARIELTLAEGKAAETLDLAERLITATANLSSVPGRVVPRLWHLRSEALLALNRLAEAETSLQTALAAARTNQQPGLRWRLQATLGRVYLAQARREPAEDALAIAQALIQELAATLTGEPLSQGNALRDNFLRQAAAQLPGPPPVSPRQQFGGLTPREREVAALIAQGKTNREIAAELILSERTAERHVANIMTKLNFNTRTQIAAWAVEKGLTSLL